MARKLSRQKPKKAGSLIKNAIGIIFVPLAFSVTRSFYAECIGIKALTHNSRYFLFGFAAYVFVYIAFFKLENLYVLGHECIHAVFVWIFGGKVLSIKVRKGSGSVSSTKKNIFIDLAPYLVPIYTILIFVIYVIASSFWKIDPFFRYFIFCVGFSFSLHVVMTIDKIKIEQPDFLDFGYLNSLVLIYLVNIILVAVCLSFLFPGFVFAGFMSSFLEGTKEVYAVIFNRLFRL